MLRKIGNTFSWFYRNLVPRHAGMWRRLREKGVITMPWRIYFFRYRFRKRKGVYIAHRRFREENLFLNVHIDTYAACSRKCKFCFNSLKQPKRKLGIMSEKIYRRIIDQLADINYCGKISPYFYGEPLCDKRLPELIAHARRKCPCSYIQINSNGDRLTEPLLLELIKAGLDKALVTDYENVGLPKNTPEEKISEQSERLLNLAVLYPQFVDLRNWNEISFENRGGLVLSRITERVKEPCMRPSYMLVIDWKGDVLLCCVDYYGQHVYGNLADRPLMVIWKDAKYQEMQRILQKPGGRQEIPICAKCDAPAGIEE
jgi:radical SAM protein with 4Fe4S-binding SPASM domain